MFLGKQSIYINKQWIIRTLMALTNGGLDSQTLVSILRFYFLYGMPCCSECLIEYLINFEIKIPTTALKLKLELNPVLFRKRRSLDLVLQRRGHK